MPKNIIKHACAFAHLLGIVAKGEDKDNQEVEDQDDDENASEPEEETSPKKDPQKDEDASEEDDDEVEDSEDEEAEGEDEDEDKESDDTKKERARCAKIFNSASAGKNLYMAAKLAFHTSMSAKQAIKALDAATHGMKASSSKRQNLSSRMAGIKMARVTPSGNTASGGGMTEAQKIIAAGKKLRGEI